MFDVPAARAMCVRELDGMTATAASLSHADWARPTRCGQWTVADLCSHSGLAAVQQAEAYRRAAKGMLEKPEFPGAPALSPAGILKQLAEGTVALAHALDQLPPESLEGLTPMPFAVIPTVVAIQLSAYEFAFHTNDLRHATGKPEIFPADIASHFITFLPVLAPILARAAAPGRPDHAYQLTAPTGSVTLAAGADGWTAVDDTHNPLCIITGPDHTIALFALGRLNADDARITISGSAATAAADFKRWFPGP